MRTALQSQELRVWHGSGGAFSDFARPLEKNFSGTDASDEERNLRIFFYEPIMQIVDFRPLHS